MTVQAHDPDCLTGTCTTGCGAYIRSDLTAWSATAGSFAAERNGTSASPYAAEADWQAPAVEGTYAISVTLADSGTMLCGGRNSVTGTVDVLVTTSTNLPPVVGAVTASPTQLLPGRTARLTCVASDPDGDALSYAWSADTGTLTPAGATATFVGSQPGIATVTCSATDPQGASGSGTASLSVTEALAEMRLTRDVGVPQRLSVDSQGDIYVADPGSGGITVLNLANGELVYRLGMADVTSVAVDWQQRLLVGRRSGAAVLDRSGRPVLALLSVEPLGPVADVAVDAARRRYAVLFGDASRILVYDETGAPIHAVGVAGDGPDGLRRPQGVAFTPEGDLVVADSGQATVKVLGLDGSLRLSFGGNGTTAGRFVRLDDVEVGANGVIYASDAFQAWVQAFNPDGTLREVIGTYGGGLGRFKTASGIVASAQDGRLIVASLNSPSLEVFRTSDAPVTTKTPEPRLSAASVLFPSTPVGAASAPQTVTLSNVGSAPLGIRRVVVNGEFRQTNDCGSFVDPEQSCAFQVTYVPETAGLGTGSLGIETSASPSHIAVALAGEAYHSPKGSLDPAQVAFADQKVATTSAPQPVTLTNTGAVALSVLGALVSPGFGVTHACPAQLPAGDRCVLEVFFAPQSPGPTSGTLTVETNAVNGPLVTSLTGHGLPRALRAEPETLDFGERSTGVRSLPSTVTITNVGGEALGLAAAVVGGADSSAFPVLRDGCAGSTLPAGLSCSVQIAFRPARVGAHAASLLLETGAGERHDLVALAGLGATPEGREPIFRDDFESGDLSSWTVRVSPEAAVKLGSGPALRPADVGSVAVGDRLVLTLMVENPQDAPVAVDRVVLIGTLGGTFEVETDSCSGQQVAGGGRCLVRISYSPLGVGGATAVLAIASGAGADSIVLAGRGRDRLGLER